MAGEACLREETAMRFVQESEGVWLLIDETAPSHACLIATVRGPVEALALKGLCEARLANRELLQPFDVTFEGQSYRVTPFDDRGGRLSLRIEGEDGSLSRVETEFQHPGNDTA
jgi:hypothetical protein